MDVYIQKVLFDHSQIVRIDHMGLIDDEEKKFKRELDDLVKNKKKKSNFIIFKF